MDFPDRPTVVDLFCGAGGLSEGFKQAGFEIILGIDSDKISIETYDARHGCGRVKNIEDVDADFVRVQTGHDRVDVLIGGPPCQGFSNVAIGKLKSLGEPRTLEHPLNQLYKEFIRLILELKPSWFVMENVSRMISIEDGSIKQSIESDLAGKYSVAFYVDN